MHEYATGIMPCMFWLGCLIFFPHDVFGWRHKLSGSKPMGSCVFERYIIMIQAALYFIKSGLPFPLWWDTAFICRLLCRNFAANTQK